MVDIKDLNKIIDELPKPEQHVFIVDYDAADLLWDSLIEKSYDNPMLMPTPTESGFKIGGMYIVRSKYTEQCVEIVNEKAKTDMINMIEGKHSTLPVTFI